MTADNSTPRWRVLDILMSQSVRQHLTIVGAALLIIGAMVLFFLPETAAIWLVVAVVVVAHTGLFMVVGSAVLNRFARRR